MSFNLMANVSEDVPLKVYFVKKERRLDALAFKH